MSDQLNGYDLSRSWFDFCFKNPELINPNHTAIFFFAIEHCNRLGWKEKFGLPTEMAKDALGIAKHQTYIKYFNDLVEWGFIKLVQKSVNQYSSNIISLQIALPKNGKALDKAIIRHGAKQGQKQTDSIGQSTGQSNSPIDKPINQLTNKPINQLVVEEEEPDSEFEMFVQTAKIKSLVRFVKQTFPKLEETLKMKIGEKNYLERQEAFILRNNEGSYTTNNDFRTHYTNFILKNPPEQKEKYSGQKEKLSKTEQFKNNHNAVINDILSAAS